MAQERCIKACLDRGRRWNPGEVRETEESDDGGKSIPTSQWWRMVGADEVIEPGDVFDPALVAEKQKESAQRDRVGAIRNALASLDPENDRHWTQKGFPSLSAVQERAKVELARNDVVAAEPDFDREKARLQKASAGY